MNFLGEAVCSHFGGAHFMTFDNKRYEFPISRNGNEKCTFVLVRHESTSGESFDVLARDGQVHIEINSQVRSVCFNSQALNMLYKRVPITYKNKFVYRPVDYVN